MADLKPRPARCWQRMKGVRKPSWVKFNLNEQSVAYTDWLVWPDDEEHVNLLHDWQFAEIYQ